MELVIKLIEALSGLIVAVSFLVLVVRLLR
jgi:uncharacterized protein YoxC